MTRGLRSSVHDYRTLRENMHKTSDVPESSADSSTLDALEARIEPEFAALVYTWPALPAAIKAGILAMIRATDGSA